MKAQRDSGMCRCCMKVRARFLFQGRVKRDRLHELCPRCYRSERDRRRAELLGGWLPEAA